MLSTEDPNRMHALRGDGFSPNGTFPIEKSPNKRPRGCRHATGACKKCVNNKKMTPPPVAFVLLFPIFLSRSLHHRGAKQARAWPWCSFLSFRILLWAPSHQNSGHETMQTDNQYYPWLSCFSSFQLSNCTNKTIFDFSSFQLIQHEKDDFCINEPLSERLMYPAACHEYGTSSTTQTWARLFLASFSSDAHTECSPH